MPSTDPNARLEDAALLDLFASSALTGLLANPALRILDVTDELADAAFDIAHLMLRARDRQMNAGRFVRREEDDLRG